MLALEKDHDHSSALVSALRARDDEHAKAMDSREKELADKHAAALAEQKSSLSQSHEDTVGETVARHEDAMATQQRKHEAELESALSALDADKEREHAQKLAEVLRDQAAPTAIRDRPWKRTSPTDTPRR
ncbi:hypothetical protein JL720_3354 [Aureococcus anophagefferens]|nr:hypothetical protein JL720_3354 [Aureococcus anophagefferens]